MFAALSDVHHSRGLGLGGAGRGESRKKWTYPTLSRYCQNSIWLGSEHSFKRYPLRNFEVSLVSRSVDERGGNEPISDEVFEDYSHPVIHLLVLRS